MKLFPVKLNVAFKSIRFRLSLLFAVLLIASVTTISWQSPNQDFSHQQSIKRGADILAGSLAITVVYPLQQQNYALIDKMLRNAMQISNLQEILITDWHGQSIINLNKHDNRIISESLIYLDKPQQPTENVSIVDDNLIIWKPLTLDTRLGWVKITQSLDSEQTMGNRAWQKIWQLMVPVLILSIVLLLWVLRKPLNALRGYTEYAAGLLENERHDLQIDSSTEEIYKLGSTLKQISADLQEQRNENDTERLNLQALAAFPANNPLLVLSINDQGVQYANPSTKRFLAGMNFKPKNTNTLMPEDMPAIVELCLTNQQVKHDVEVEVGDKTLLWTFSPVSGQNLVHGYGYDISARKAVEAKANKATVEKLLAIQANTAKSAFLANMSHEIRTPLTAIIGFSESLLDDEQSNSERVNGIQTIINSGRHLFGIINNILDLSKIEAGKMEIENILVDIFPLLRNVYHLADMQAQEKGIEFAIDYQFPLPEQLISDPVRIQQVLLNLCNNAIKFTKKGRVKVKVNYDRYQGMLRFDVIDTGIGLSEEQRNKLFTAFSQADSSTTREFGGTGLGLHLSAQLVESMGGTITVSSDLGKGSCFTVILDARLPESAVFTNELPSTEHSPIFSHSKTAPQFTGHVLVAEDNINNQQLVNLYIRKLGVDVTFANNGQEAVDLALEKNFNLILMDMQMPVMDGLEATRALVEAKCRIPVVALTANVMQEDREKCRAAGCIDFLGKPIDRKQFYEVVSRYLEPTAELVNPIYSKSLSDDPGMNLLIEEFLADLPAILNAIQQQCQQENWEKLGELIHDMKAVGGSYGFPQLTEASIRIREELERHNLTEVVSLVNELETLCTSILLGRTDASLNGSGQKSAQN